MHRSLSILFVLAAASLTGAACEVAKSANPLSPDVAGPIPGVHITAPKPLEPSSGAELSVTEAPHVELLIENAGTNGQRPLWLEVELAADAAFAQVLHQADRVTPGENGQTTYRVPEPLGAGHTYYWRARALDGANTGPYSEVAHFTLAEPIVIETPVPVAPSGLITTNQPEFRVTNGRVSGAVGSVVYRFELGTSAEPGNPAAVVSVTPGTNGTTTMSMGQLPWDTTIYWRVYATDGATTSPPSAMISFRTPPAPPTPGPAPGPGPTPPPTPPPGPVGQRRTISPEEALQIIRRVHDSEGWNLGSGSSRGSRVDFFFRAVAAIHYGHSRYNPAGPDPNWCVKDAGGGRPPSDDVMVRCDSREAWDTIGGAGANGYRFHLDHIGRLPGNQNVYAPPASAIR